MSLAQTVRDLRYTRGWGPEELAERANITRAAVYEIESGKTQRPRASTLRQLAVALEVSTGTLLGLLVPSQGQGSAPRPTPDPRSSCNLEREGCAPFEGTPMRRPIPLVGASFPAQASPSLSTTARQDVMGEPRGSFPHREEELVARFRMLLATPLGESLAQLVVQAHQLLFVSAPRPGPNDQRGAGNGPVCSI